MVGEEDELEIAGRPVALLGDDHVGDPLALGVALVQLFAVEHDDDVGVLLERARVAQVGQLRLSLIPLALFGLSGKLRQRDDRDLQLLGQELQAARDLRDLLRAVVETAVARHQLEVIHEDQVEPLLPLQALRLGAHHGHRHGGAVIDEEVRPPDRRLREHEPLDRLLRGIPVADLLGIHVGLRAEDPEAELLHGHLQRKEPDGLPRLAQGDMLRDVQREGGLAHGGARREDDQVGGLESRGHPVELREARGQAREHALPGARVLDDFQVVLDDLSDRREGLAHGIVGDLEDLARDVVQELFRGLVLRQAVPNDPLAGADQPPQRRLFLDDPGIVLDVADIRHPVDQPGEVGRVHRLGAAGVQLLLEREQVDLGGPFEEVEHAAEDPLVLVAVEIVLFQDRNDERDCGRVEQDRAEHGALRLSVLRQRFLGRDGLFEHRFFLETNCPMFYPQRSGVNVSERFPQPRSGRRPIRAGSKNISVALSTDLLNAGPGTNEVRGACVPPRLTKRTIFRPRG